MIKTCSCKIQRISFAFQIYVNYSIDMWLFYLFIDLYSTLLGHQILNVSFVYCSFPRKITLLGSIEPHLVLSIISPSIILVAISYTPKQLYYIHLVRSREVFGHQNKIPCFISLCHNICLTFHTSIE